MLKEVRLYIETSIRGPRRQTGAYAYVLEYRAAAGPVTLTEVKAIPDTTEHQSLCMGILAAVKRLKSCDLTICTSSGYIQAVFECWMDNWIANGFKTAKGEPIKDAEKWQEIAERLNGLPVRAEIAMEHTYRDWMLREVDKAVKSAHPKSRYLPCNGSNMYHEKLENMSV